MKPASLSLSFLAASLLFGGCAGSSTDSFSRIPFDGSKRSVDESDDAERGTEPECRIVSGSLLLGDGMEAPPGAEVLMLSLQPGELDESGFPIPGFDPVDQLSMQWQGGEPLAWEVCAGPDDAVLVALLDPQSDGSICDDGDLYGTEQVHFEGDRWDGVALILDTIVSAGDCGNQD